jgi:hypothetical protein
MAGYKNLYAAVFYVFYQKRLVIEIYPQPFLVFFAKNGCG